MFSEEDVEKLEEIINLTHQLGVNLAGVEMILQLHKKIEKMQSDMNKLFAKTQQELTQETQSRKELIHNYSAQLYEKKEIVAVKNNSKKVPSAHENTAFKDWDIDYE